MRWLSELTECAKYGVLKLVILFLCLLLPDSLIAEEYGSISGTVYQNDGITTVQSDWGIAAFRASNHDFVSGSPIGVNGTYTITGLPPGEYLIRTEPSINHGAGIYYDNTPYFEQRSTITISGAEHITGIDFILEYPIFVEIHTVKRPDNTFDAYYGIYFFYFNDFDLSSVKSITMEGPSGTPAYQYNRESVDQVDQNDFVENQHNGFHVLAEDVEPPEGEYTFEVETDDFSTTVIHVRNQNIDMPVLDAGTLSPADGSIITSGTPVFEWGSLENPQMPVYYRLQVYDDTGYRVYASERSADMRSIALPEGLLQPGQTYTWRVQINDSSDYTRVENLSVTESFTITMADDTTPGTNPPVIHIDGFGAWKASSYNNDDDSTGLWVKVIDHDGIAVDGSSHQVSVTFNGQTRSLNLYRYNSAFEAAYEAWLGTDPTAVAGEYVFTVTDPDGHSATATDTLVVEPLPIPDQNTFNVISEVTSPVFTWDPVPGASRYRIRIWDENWNIVWNGYQMLQSDMSYTVPPGILLPHTFYFSQLFAWDDFEGFDVDNTSSSNHIAFNTGETSVNPMLEITHGAATRNSGDQGTYLYFWTKVHDAQGVPDDIRSVTAAFPDGTTIPLQLDYNESGTCGIYYAEDFGWPIAAGEYTITVEDLDGNTHSVTDILDVNRIGYPEDSSVSATVNGTQVDVTWEAIEGAAYYRLELHDMEGNRINNLSTIENYYSIPAGYLKENTPYQYRITTWRELFDQGIDNSSRSVMKVFDTAANQEMDMQGIILAAADANTTIPGGQSTTVYGTSGINEVTVESGSYAELINFPGSNLIEFESDATLFEISRSGTMVTFQGTDGTTLKIPATSHEQTIIFNNDGIIRLLRIEDNQVKLNDQVIGPDTAEIAE
jgi:hypothetical protein